MRNKAFTLAWWSCALLVAAGSVVARVEAGVTIVDGGRPVAVVVVPVGAAEEERRAAEEVVRVVEVMTGARLAVVAGRPWWPAVGHRRVVRVRPGVVIEVGRAAAESASLARSGADVEAQVVVVEPGRVALAGATPAAAERAAYRWLEEAGGVAWVMPGDRGEVVPRRSTWVVEAAAGRVEVPAFLSREYWGVGGPEGEAWLRRNGLWRRWDHGHAVARWVPADAYEAHPEWFPELGGARYRPAGPEDGTWQPNLALPEVAEVVAASVARHVAGPEGPGAGGAVSVAIQDTTRFDESRATAELVQPLRWFRGRPDYGALVWAFTRRVAERLDALAVNREVRLSAYAYFWAEAAPREPLPERVMPWLTADRSQWIHEPFAAEDRELMEAWGRAAPGGFGVYDYWYGDAFAVPRLFLAEQAAALRVAHAAGARGFFAELRPVWGFDAPKAWIGAKLLQEPGADAAELLGRFCRAAYGPAAPRMEAFFRGAEAAWRAQPGPARWIKYYMDPTQGELLPAEVRRRLAAELAAAEALAQSDPAAAERVAATSRAWALAEAAAQVHERRLAVAALAARARPPGILEAGSALVELRAAEQAVREAASTLRAAGDAAGDFAFLFRADTAGRLLARLVDAGADGAAMEGVTTGDTRTAERSLARTLAAGGVRGRNLVANGAFEVVREPSPVEVARRDWFAQRVGAWPSSWRVEYRPAEGAGFGVEPGRGVGGRGLVVRGADGWAATQPVAVEGGRLYELRARVRGEVPGGSEVSVGVTWTDAAGKVVGATARDRLERGRHETWRELAVFARAPRGAAWAFVALVVNGQVGGAEVVVDDVRFGAWTGPIFEVPEARGAGGGGG